VADFTILLIVWGCALGALALVWLLLPGLVALFAWTNERVGKFWCSGGAHSWTPRRIHLPDPVRCKRCGKLKGRLYD